MSGGGPLSNQRNDDALPSTSTQSITSSVADTTTKDVYTWLPNETERKATRSNARNKMENCSALEYTSEHLEKALLDLRTSTHQYLQEWAGQSVSTTMGTLPGANHTETSTEISYPVNQKQVNATVEIKPVVENISTQSSADRVRLNIQTTTDDLPQPPIQLETVPEKITEATSVMSDESLALTASPSKSKLPVFKPDQASSSPSTVNILVNNNQNKIAKPSQKYCNSKIPQRMAINSTPSRECIPSKLTANINRAPTLRAKNTRFVNNDRQLLQSALAHSTANIPLPSPSETIDVTSNEMQLKAAESDKKCIEEQSGLPTVPIQTKKEIQKENKENLPIVDKVSNKLQQQTADSTASALKPSKSNSVDGENQKDTEETKNIKKENIQMNKMETNVSNLSYNFAIGRTVHTTTDDLQTDAFNQAEDNDNKDSLKLYEKQVYKDEPVVQLIEVENKLNEMKNVKEKQENLQETCENNNKKVVEDKKTENLDQTKKLDKPAPKLINPPVKNLPRESKTCLIATPSKAVINKPPPKEVTGLKEIIFEKSPVSSTSNAIPKKPIEIKTPKQAKKEACEILQEVYEVKKEIRLNAENLNDELAHAVNIFNIAQSQRINTILRMAMPYNDLILPVFISSPSSIIQALGKELLNTIDMKRRAAFCFNGIINKNQSKNSKKLTSKTPSKQCLKSSQNGVSNASKTVKTTKTTKTTKSSITRIEEPSTTCHATVIGPQLIANHRATWAKPPFYYGRYKEVSAKE